jgi:hypothetical protein
MVPQAADASIERSDHEILLAFPTIVARVKAASIDRRPLASAAMRAAGRP